MEMMEAGELLKSMSPIINSETNDEAERGVLAGLLSGDDRVVIEIDDTGLIETDFYFEDHRLIFRSTERLKRRGRKIDIVTVADDLDRRGELELSGGHGKISELGGQVMSPSICRSYAEIIKDKSRMRSLKVALNVADHDVKAGSKNVDDILNSLSADLSDIENKMAKKKYDISATTKNCLDKMVALGNQRDAMPTGFQDFDNLCGGLGNGDLMIVAGRPSMGKTCFALDVARNVAIKDKKTVMIFSLEMSDEQLVDRLISAECKVSTKKNNASKDEISSIVSAAATISESSIVIDDTAGLRVSDIRARAKSVNLKQKIDLLIVDYIQLISSERNLSSRTGEVSEISNSLKRLARELSCPVIVVSQLNRGPEARTDKRPLMSDLRESGAIEQDADQIVLLFREEYYGGPKTPEENKGKAELILSKNRNGPTGIVELSFISDVPCFADLTRIDYGEF